MLDPSVEDERYAARHYFWVRTGLGPADLDELLSGTMLERGTSVLTNADLTWLYHPCNAGADVILPTTAERDTLRERHADWLSDRADGL